MHSTNGTSDSVFRRQIEELRVKIDSLPGEKQPHLWWLLEKTEQQHADWQADCLRIRQMLDGLSNLEQKLRFCQEAIKRSSPTVD